MKTSRSLFGTSVVLNTNTIYKANYNDIISVDTNYSVTIQLPEPKDIVTLYVLDNVGKASINNIVISRPPGETYTIDGYSSIFINNDYGSVYLVSDGSIWKVISGENVISPQTSTSNISAPTLYFLSVFDDAAVPNGSLASVNSLLDIFYLDKGSNLISDGITIIDTNSGVGRWIRLGISNISWSYQDTWFIDSASGSDENSGKTSSQSLKTFNEWSRRVGSNSIKIEMTINVLNDLEITDELLTYINIDTYNGKVIIDGQSGISQLYSGTVTSLTTCNPLTNTPWSIIDSSLPSEWSTYIDHSSIGKRIKFTSGVSSGAISWMAKDLGLKECRISQPSIPNFNYDITNQPTSSINIGDDFVIEQIPIIYNFCPTISVPVGKIGFVVKNLGITSSPGVELSSPKSHSDSPKCLGFYNCDLNIKLNGQESFINCRFIHLDQKNPQDVNWIFGGLFVGNSTNEYSTELSRFVADNRFMIQGARLYCYGGSGESIISSVQIYDCPHLGDTGAITIESTAATVTIKSSFSGLKEVFGQYNDNVGIKVLKGGSLQYDTDVVGICLTGNSGDFNLGYNSPPRSYSNLPMYEVEKRKLRGVQIVTGMTSFITIA